MLTRVEDKDDGERASRGIVLSVKRKDNGALRLTLDRVVMGTASSEWRKKAFETHYDIDQGLLDLLKYEMTKPLEEQHGIGASDAILLGIGNALIVPLLAEALSATGTDPS